MSKLLDKAFAEASKLPQEEQDSFAAMMLAELASERRWTEAFGKPQDKLAALAEEALAEFKDGKTEPFTENDDIPYNEKIS
ncbi:MAG: hypothetical protein DMG25_19295 [Acidobacteria bacterium]|nr:MAG: hypothetical protein DMG25_19295 [Acidobacteriota bacterium]PYV20367.1 MAG: hypothetical protein DMG27_23240 [Acidobacteriota bacterium]